MSSGLTVRHQASVGGALMGSSHKYVVPGARASNRVDLIRSQKTEGVEMAIAPEELEDMDAETLRQRYEQQEASKRAGQYADVSDVVAEELGKRQKRKAGGAGDQKSKKAKEDFKF